MRMELLASATNSILIERPIAEVFDYIAHGENNAAWRPGVVDIKRVSGSYAEAGAEYEQTLSGPLGRSIAGDYRVTELRKDKRIAFQVIAGPARPAGSYDFSTEGGSTRVVFSLTFEPRGLQRLMAPMIQATMNKEVGNLVRLKELLEKRPTSR